MEEVESVKRETRSGTLSTSFKCFLIAFIPSDKKRSGEEEIIESGRRKEKEGKKLK